MSSPEHQEYVFISIGEFSATDKDAVENLLSEEGLTTSAFTLESYIELLNKGEAPMPKATRPLPAFADLTSRDDYITKEHFEEFRQDFAPDFSKRVATIAFNGCIDVFPRKHTHSLDKDDRQQYIERYVTTNKPTLRTFPNLVVKLRSELGFPEAVRGNTTYRANMLARYAIQIGSLVDTNDGVHSEDQPRFGDFLDQLIAQLDNQLNL